MTWRITATEDVGLPRRLRAARKRARMTLSQVADCIGRDTSTVHTWETGKRGLSFDDLASYGTCVHASITDLIGDDLPPEHAMSHHENDELHEPICPPEPDNGQPDLPAGAPRQHERRLILPPDFVVEVIGDPEDERT